MKTNRYLQAAVLEVLDNQLSANDPPETRQAYARLIESGLSVKDTRRLLGCVSACEVFEVLKNQERFNLGRFVRRLNELPDLSWLDE